MDHEWSQYSVLPLFHYSPPADERRQLSSVNISMFWDMGFQRNRISDNDSWSYPLQEKSV